MKFGMVDEADFYKQPIVEQCIGCDRIEGKFCSAYYMPFSRWRLGKCPLATHIKAEVKKEATKARVGQQKSKKKAKI